MMRKTIWAMLAVLPVLAACSETGGEAGDSDGGGGEVTLTRDATVGARYGAAGPRSCSLKNVPAKGPPSPLQAAAYVTCEAEKESSNTLYLVDKLVVTDVAPGRPYERNQGARYNIDVNQPVYAIRGSMVSYSCTPTYGEPTGRNCYITHERNAEGDCCRNTFGDWRCFMGDARAKMHELSNQPPPA